jgi:hypothetical protein
VTTVLFVILGLIWGFVLIPPYLQNRRESRPADSIASFRAQLRVLERTTPGRSGELSHLDVGGRHLPLGNARTKVAQLVARDPRMARPASSRTAQRRAEIRRRRHDVFVTLLGAVGVSFLLGVAVGGKVWMLHALIDIAFVAYVGLLVSLQQQTSEREVKVRQLPPNAVRNKPQPQLAIRRYGS